MMTVAVMTLDEVTFRKGVLKRLGIDPGKTIELDLQPDGRAEIRADERQGSWDDLLDFFAGKTNGAQLSIEGLDNAIAEAVAAYGGSGVGKSRR